MAAKLYNKALESILLGEAPMEDGTIGVDAGLVAALVESGYTFNAAHDLFSDLTNVCTGTGYATKPLENVTVTVSDADNWVTVDCDDITWSSVSCGTPARLIVMSADVTGNRLIACIDIDSPIATDGNDYVVHIHADGLFRVTNT